MQAPLVNGHGNFGSLDDDPPAAMRYTECRLQHLSSAMLLAVLEADTVDFGPNFDSSVVSRGVACARDAWAAATANITRAWACLQMEPLVLPARVPNLLVNGSSGIAVGIATKIPPHNMREVVDGLRALIRNPDISVQELMQHIPGPDFPTGWHSPSSRCTLSWQDLRSHTVPACLSVAQAVR